MYTISGIQYLRAIAAIMVVFHHASLMVPGADNWSSFGATGVDIFFIISGFIMAYSTRGFVADGDKINQALVFFRKRIIRVVPLYWIALLWTSKVMIIKNTVDLNLMSDFLFFPRFHSTGNIWPELVVGWTLNYEMFFYLIFSIAMLFGRSRYIFFTFIFLTIIIFSSINTWSSASIIFYTSSILLEFLLGIGVYFLSLKLFFPKNILIFILLVASTLLILDNGSLPRAIADGLPSAVIVYSTLTLFKDTNFKLMSKLGDASYSIYLFHLGAFSLLGHALRIFEWDSQALPSAIFLFLVTCLGIMTGLILNKVLEKPLLIFLREKFEKS